MRTYLDCIPCFFKQTIEAARLSGADTIIQKRILDDVARALPKFPLESTPPEMGRIIHTLIKKHTGKKDPYLPVKEKSIRLAHSISGRIIQKISNSHDRLLTAVHAAIFSNIIDFGAKNNLNIEEEINRILHNDLFSGTDPENGYFQYRDFHNTLKRARSILYLLDNAGETVFDRILIEEIKRIDPGKSITCVVKDAPIINDAVEKDALDSGIDRVADIVSSGSDAPGTILSLCSGAFRDLYHQSEMVISKGQGNFEGLSDTDRDIFFLLIAKCPVIAKDIGCRMGDFILLRHRGTERTGSGLGRVSVAKQPVEAASYENEPDRIKPDADSKDKRSDP